METKNFFGSLLAVLMIAILSVGLLSCSKEDNDDIPSGVFGTWSGSQTSKTGSKREIIVTFRSNRTGSFQYSSKTYFRMAEFTFGMNSSTITCDGIIVGEDGVSNKFYQQFDYYESYIVPRDSYSDITLTR